jgi:hypothetical protein
MKHFRSEIVVNYCRCLHCIFNERFELECFSNIDKFLRRSAGSERVDGTQGSQHCEDPLEAEIQIYANTFYKFFLKIIFSVIEIVLIKRRSHIILIKHYNFYN